jgi:ribonuclease H / adenosylcobalamin/alpha-ribazole phosphatase
MRWATGSPRFSGAEVPTTWLIRHAPTAFNANHVFMGSRDVPASAEGLAKARELVAESPIDDVGVVYSSPLRRALATSEAAFPDTPLRVDSRLAERGLGGWEGVGKEQLRRDYPGAFVAGGFLDLRCTPVGGEPISALFERVRDFMFDLYAARHEGQSAVVSHNGVIRLIRYILGLCELDHASATPERFLAPVSVTWNLRDLRADVPVERAEVGVAPP